MVPRGVGFAGVSGKPEEGGMKRRWGVGLALVLAGSPGCAPKPDAAVQRAAIMAADRAFAEATALRGAEGWTSYFEEGASQFHARGVSIGLAEIRRTMTRAFADTTGRLVWHPVRAVVAASGDLGYTIGRWESRVLGADGKWAADGTGNYVTVWRRQDDGNWKVAVDIGNQDAPPPNTGKR
jgi:ketosteroid isomerase-like protein